MADIIDWAQWVVHCKELESAQNQFVNAINEISFSVREKKGKFGKWSAKDLLAHISGWELEVIKMFNLFLTDPNVNDEYNINTFNNESVSARERLSWEEILNELKSAQKELNALISKLDQKQLNSESRFTEWIGVLNNHYHHHTNQINEMKSFD